MTILRAGRLFAATALLLTAATARPGAAQEGDAMQAMRVHCLVDYMRFCPGMNPDGQDVRSCFRRNRPNLSAACNAAIEAYERGQAGQDQ